VCWARCRRCGRRSTCGGIGGGRTLCSVPVPAMCIVPVPAMSSVAVPAARAPHSH
jgi:hypothetical protein